MSKIVKMQMPIYRKSANSDVHVKIKTEQEYVWIECSKKEHKQLSYRYEKTFTPRGLPLILFDTYVESNEAEFIAAVQKYVAYSDELKDHLNKKK